MGEGKSRETFVERPLVVFEIEKRDVRDTLQIGTCFGNKNMQGFMTTECWKIYYQHPAVMRPVNVPIPS